MKLLLPACLSLLLIVTGCDPEPQQPDPAGAEIEAVSGTITYRERVVLPPESRLEVNISRVEGDELVAIADTSFTTQDQVPIRFSLGIHTASIDTTGQYVLTARLSSPDDRLQWTTPAPIPVLTRGAPSEIEAVLHTVERAQEVRQEPWLQARARGVAFRAVGQEPGWRLDVFGAARNPNRIELALDYSEEARRYDTVLADTDGDGNLRYRIGEGDEAVEAIIEDGQCRDTMSGELFEALVTVRVADRTLSGCGRSLL